MTLPRNRANSNGAHGHVVDYLHTIHSLRRKPRALAGPVYSNQIFPRPVFRHTFERLLETDGERTACRTMVELLALAHERTCEAELAELLADGLAQDRLPDLDVLRQRFAPQPGSLPQIVVELAWSLVT